MIFVKYNSSNIPLLTHSHSLFLFRFIYVYINVHIYSVFVLWSKKINYMKNIFLWYFFPYNHLSPAAARRCINTKLDCRDLRRNIERQQSKLHLFLFFFSLTHEHYDAHIHRHLNHKNTFSYVFLHLSNNLLMCVCEFTCAFAYYVAHFPSSSALSGCKLPIHWHPPFLFLIFFYR